MFYLILFLAKLINLIIKITKIGAGYTWPGHIALKLYPSLFKDPHFKFQRGIIFVSGTNGKTTTTKLITHIFKRAGSNVLHNKSGANLLNGIASSLLLDTSFFGKTRSDLAVFEVDELTLPELLRNIPPTVLVLLNLSRDQLDRYGEIDTILSKWEDSVKALDAQTVLVLDSTQKYFDQIGAAHRGKIFYFDDDVTTLHLTKLVGDFNAKNVNASITVASLLGVSKEQSLVYLSGFEAAYGRGEMVEHGTKLFHLFLAKNPTSFNNNLELLLANELSPDTLFFILNDEIRDGRDVSWIYDISREKLFEACKDREIFIAGSRCLDMAIRLKYAGLVVNESNIGIEAKKIIGKIESTPHTKIVAVFPNYSAMLDVREVLLGRQIL